MSLSFPYSAAFMEISAGIEEPTLDDGFNQSALSHFPCVYGSCCIAFVWCLLLHSKSSSLSSLPHPPHPLFHFHSLIEVFLQAKCFLIRCSTNYFFNKTLTLNFDFLFKWELSTNGCWETHQMGEHGHRRKKIWPGGIHFMVSLWGWGWGECVYNLLCTLLALLLCLCVGCLQCMWGICTVGSCCFRVCIRKSGLIIECVSVCSLSVLVLIIFVCVDVVRRCHRH